MTFKVLPFRRELYPHKIHYKLISSFALTSSVTMSLNFIGEYFNVPHETIGYLRWRRTNLMIMSFRCLRGIWILFYNILNACSLEGSKTFQISTIIIHLSRNTHTHMWVSSPMLLLSGDHEHWNIEIESDLNWKIIWIMKANDFFQFMQSIKMCKNIDESLRRIKKGLTVTWPFQIDK